MIKKINMNSPISMHGQIQLEKGEIVFIEGETGSGKSMIMYSVLKNLNIFSSAVYLSQKNLLMDEWTILENFRLFHIHKEIMEYYLKKVGIELDVHTKVNRLSGGEKQRVALAIAIARNPTYLLLDEPLSHLDDEHAKMVMELLVEEAHKCNSYILMVNHNITVNHYASRIYRVKENRIELEKETNNFIQEVKGKPKRFNLFYYLLKDITYKWKNYLTLILLAGLVVGLFRISNYIKEQTTYDLTSSYSNYIGVKLNNENFDEDLKQLSSLGIKEYYVDSDSYNGYSSCLCTLIDEVEFVEYEGDNGLFVREEDALEYNIQLGDLVIQKEQEYTITGIIKEGYHAPIRNNANIVFFLKDFTMGNLNYVIKMDQVLEFEQYEKQIKEIDENIIAGAGDPYLISAIDYSKTIMKITKSVCIIGIVFLSVIYGLMENRYLSEKYEQFAYLKCHHLSSIKCILLDIWWIVLITIIFRDIVWIILLFIVHLSICIYYLVPYQRFIRSIRSNE